MFRLWSLFSIIFLSSFSLSAQLVDTTYLGLTTDTLSSQWIYDAVSDGANGMIAVGSYVSSGTTKRPLVIRIDPQGTILWDMALPGVNWVISIAPNSDGSFSLCGRSGTFFQRYTTTNVNLNGTINWHKEYILPENPNHNRLLDHVSLPNGELMLLGEIGADQSFQDVYWKLMKLDTIGDTIWTKNLNVYSTGFGQEFDLTIKSYQQGFLITGIRHNGKTSVIFVDNNGNEVWERQYPEIEMYPQLLATDDNGYLLVGSTTTLSSTTPRTHFRALKVDAVGNVVWDIEMESILGPVVQNLFQTDNGFVVSGQHSPLHPTTNQHTPSSFAAKLSTSGDSCRTETFWDFSLRNAAGLMNSNDELVQVNNNYFYYTLGQGSPYKINVLKFDSLSYCDSVVTVAELPNTSNPSIFPNPTSGKVTLADWQKNDHITVYNAFGQLIIGQTKLDQSALLDLSAFPAGVYFITQYRSGTKPYTTKVVRE